MSTPLIAPRLLTFNSSCVFIGLIVAGEAPGTGGKPGALVPAAARVEEFGVAAVVVAAEEGAVADLLEAVLLEDALHAVVVGEGRAADVLEAQGVEDVPDEELDGLARVAPAAQVVRALS